MVQAIGLPMSIVLLFLPLLLSSCVSVAETKIYENQTERDFRAFAVLPFGDETVEKQLNEETLASYQHKLVHLLGETHTYSAISINFETSNLAVDAVIENSFTQYDLSARRVVVKTEIKDPDTGAILMKFITRSELVSLVWPIDYIGALERSSDKIVNKIVEAISDR
jgi:hypothetical protein